jgi:phospholipase C
VERFISLRSISAVALLACAAGCSPASHSLSPGGGAQAIPMAQQAKSRPAPRGGSQGTKIQHVVIIVQENRSFDNLFQGFPKADTVSSGLDSSGNSIALTPVSLATQYVIDHSLTAYLAACDGSGSLPGTNCKNDGFNNEVSFDGPSKNPQYVYVPHNESKPYFDMAHEWVLADEMHQSHLDESFVAHQYIIAAQAQSAVNLPSSYIWGCRPKGITVQMITQERELGNTEAACFDSETIGDELDAAGLTWHFYTSVVKGDGGEWSGYQAISHIRNGPDWAADVITPQTKFLTDVSKGLLENVTWITPICANSDHVNCGGGFGPSWVTSLVNAVGESPFWDSTAIFVVWDDWGGLYDHVPPVFEDYDGTGFRVPLLVISPYAKQDHVSHVMYETGSILHFVEDTFGLAPLTTDGSDARSNSPAKDCFDFNKPPRAFVPIKAPKNTDFFMHQFDDGRPPDDG